MADGNICYNCFADISPDAGGKCPVCGFAARLENEPWQLDAGTLLTGRYLVGRAASMDESSIEYAAWDTTLEKPLRVREYFPTASASRQRTATGTFVMAAPGRAEAFGYGQDAFLERAKVMGRDGNSGLLNFLTVGGSSYMVSDLPRERPALRYPAPAPAPASEETSAPKHVSELIWRIAAAVFALLFVISAAVALTRGGDRAVSSTGLTSGEYETRIAKLESELKAVESERDEALAGLTDARKNLGETQESLESLGRSYPDDWVVIGAVYNAGSEDGAELKFIDTELKSEDMRYLCMEFEVHSSDYAAIAGNICDIRVYRPDGTLWQGAGSPADATGSVIIETADTVYAWAWGNSDKSDYETGTYTIVFVCGGEIIGGFLAEVG